MIRTVSPAFLSAFFLAFRLTYAPVVGFFHTEHGAPWLVTGLILLLALGGEWLRRRIDARSGPGPLSSDPTRRRRATLLVILALILLGFTPEEGLIGLILWAGIGLAWADVLPGPLLPARLGWVEASAGLAGMAVGLLGILGPSPWLAALLLGGLLWNHKEIERG